MKHCNPQKQHRQKKMFGRQQNALQYHYTQRQTLQGNGGNWKSVTTICIKVTKRQAHKEKSMTTD